MNKKNTSPKRVLPDKAKTISANNALTLQQLSKAMFIDRCQIANTFLRDTLLHSAFAGHNTKAYKHIIQARDHIAEASKMAGDVTLAIETF